MSTYTTIDGRVLDLSKLDGAESRYFDRCVAAFRAGASWTVFMTMVRGQENPLLVSSGGVITQTVHDHPLFRALRDLEDRLGIRQGFLRWDGDLQDPLSDNWLPVTECAVRKGVSVQAIYVAIDRGDLVARDTAPKQVSLNSLGSWQPDAARQKAGLTRTVQHV